MSTPRSDARRDHNGQTILASTAERVIDARVGVGAVDGKPRASPAPPAAALTSKRRRTRGKSVALSVGLPLIPAVIFVAIWQAYVTSAGSLVIPTPIDVVEGFWSLIGSPDVWEAFWISNQAFLGGFAASLLIGVPLGIAMGRFRKLELLVDSWLSTMLVTPMAMLVPLLIMAFGFSLGARCVVVVLFALPIVTVNCRAGVREVDPSLVEMARTFGAGEVTVWRRILLPSASPAIWTGVRLGLGRAITGMVLVELLLAAVGFGKLLQEYQGSFETGKLYAAIAMVVTESLLLISAAKRIERLMIPWAGDSVSSRQ